MKRPNSIKNGKRGGRPKINSYLSKLTLPENYIVVLTECQYNTLIEKYGFDLIKKAIEVLDEWLKTSPSGYKSKGKNNYAYFRSDGWVINMARKLHS